MMNRNSEMNDLASIFMYTVIEGAVESGMYGTPAIKDHAEWVSRTYNALRREATYISVPTLKELEAKFLDAVKREYAERGNGQDILNGQRWTLIDGRILYEDDLPNICLKADYIEDGRVVLSKGPVDVLQIPCDEQFIIVRKEIAGEEFQWEIETYLLEVCSDRP